METRLRTEEFTCRFDGEERRLLRGRSTRLESHSEPAPAVILVHGFKGFLSWGFFPLLQEGLAQRGIVSVAINLSGSGVGEDLMSFTDDDGFFHSTPSRDVQDLERIRDAIRSGEIRGIDSRRLGLFGHSRGGGTVLLHAASRADYRAVVTWSSVAETNRFSPEFIEEWRAAGVCEVRNARTGKVHRAGVDWIDDVESNAAALDIEAACARSRTPTLLVHGTADETVPVSEQEQLARAFPAGIAEKLTVEGAGHTFGAVHPLLESTPALDLVLESTLKFFEERVRLGTRPHGFDHGA